MTQNSPILEGELRLILVVSVAIRRRCVRQAQPSAAAHFASTCNKW